jgi:hypothetical protein
MLSEDFLEDLTTRTDEEVRKKLGYCTNLHIWRAIERAAREAAIEECCAAIKAEDDRMADEDYMLDSDDCIAAIRALREGS